MIPVGYMYKQVAKRPTWLKTEAVSDIYSLSGCISANFADYVNYWKHNGYWLFDSPFVMEEIAQAANINLAKNTLFYYEVYEREFDEETKEWFTFAPDPAFVTVVQAPLHRQLAGFDITTFTMHTSPECSPLSCNALADTIPVNEYCLLPTFDEAKAALDNGFFHHSEPGPYRIFAVYTL